MNWFLLEVSPNFVPSLILLPLNSILISWIFLIDLFWNILSLLFYIYKKKRSVKKSMDATSHHVVFRFPTFSSLCCSIRYKLGTLLVPPRNVNYHSKMCLMSLSSSSTRSNTPWKFLFPIWPPYKNTSPSQERWVTLLSFCFTMACLFLLEDVFFYVFAILS